LNSPSGCISVPHIKYRGMIMANMVFTDIYRKYPC
jgi:hypothetical protein